MYLRRETLQVKYKGKSIADVLEMDVQTALAFFANVPRIQRILKTMLSGGEAQHVKLDKELARVATGRTVYILDEPTTGCTSHWLHFADVQKSRRRVIHILGE